MNNTIVTRNLQQLSILELSKQELLESPQIKIKKNKSPKK